LAGFFTPAIEKKKGNPTTMAKVSFKKVIKKYGDNLVIKGLDLEVQDKEFLVLVGPSGCGKSTALRMIAGLEEISEGELWIGDRVVNDVHPKHRDIAMVFQNYALYPHMSVRENMGFALKLRKTPKAEIDRLVNEAAQRLEISHLLDRKPKALSGGQRQRVALGRAIVRKPSVFLMDEPLSNLDAKLRVTMRSEIKKLHQQLQTTFVYVTHDQTEALTMGDRIAIFNAGYMQQVGTPNEVYNRPVNMFVASFIGSPQMNLVEGTATVEGNQIVVTGPQFRFILPKPEGFNGGKVVLGFRPEHLEPAPADQTDNVYRAPVEMLEPMGHEAFVYLKSEKNPVLARVLEAQMPKIGETFGLTLDLGKIHLFDPATENRLN
jgi:multiple sugar transport system ATP-binding protein